jgi:hypothetical protein
VRTDRSTGWPLCSPYVTYPDAPRPSETPPDQWERFYNWTAVGPIADENFDGVRILIAQQGITIEATIETPITGVKPSEPDQGMRVVFVYNLL